LDGWGERKNIRRVCVIRMVRCSRGARISKNGTLVLQQHRKKVGDRKSRMLGDGEEWSR